MPGRGLLDRISSPDPRRHDDVMKSVVINMTSILNTHEGDGFTCPDMGCDFVGLLSQWPASETDVLMAVKRSIEKYEPRLCNVQVRRINYASSRVELEITGQLRETTSRDRVKFRTELSQVGHVNVG